MSRTGHVRMSDICLDGIFRHCVHSFFLFFVVVVVLCSFALKLGLVCGVWGYMAQVNELCIRLHQFFQVRATMISLRLLPIGAITGRFSCPCLPYIQIFAVSEVEQFLLLYGKHATERQCHMISFFFSSVSASV